MGPGPFACDLVPSFITMEFKELPSNVYAEQSIIGSMLIDQTLCNTMIKLVKPEYFYLFAHQVIVSAIIEMSKVNEIIDPITVAEKLQTDVSLMNAGGMVYLSQLVSFASMPANLESHTKIIKEKYLRRELHKLLLDTSEKIFEDISVEEIINTVNKKLSQLPH